MSDDIIIEIQDTFIDVFYVIYKATFASIFFFFFEFYNNNSIFGNSPRGEGLGNNLDIDGATQNAVRKPTHCLTTIAIGVY